jgi:DNA topoisomerase I
LADAETPRPAPLRPRLRPDAGRQESAKLAASAAGLNYTSDACPGIRRRKRSGHFIYLSPRGAVIRDRAAIKRYNSLAVPPAYRDVWISPDPRAHIQATGRDARGRKQYRYHPRWQALQEAAKYERMRAFGRALPRIRARVAADLRREGACREKVLATLARLLERTLIRVGNEEYARTNKSYGLTTLRNHHVDVNGAEVHFQFRGKSGVVHDITVHDPRIAQTLRRCLHIPGRELFQYLDEEGRAHPVQSADVNAYIQEISGADFTAKDYRTWVGSVLALAALSRLRFDSPGEARSNTVKAIKSVAACMGNTPAVCRKSYIHPGLLEAYESGRLRGSAARRARTLRQEERAFLRFLQQRGGHRRRRAFL